MLRIMAERFVRDGHEVTVFSTQPGYNDVSNDKLPRRQFDDGIEEFRVGILKENKKNTLVRAINVALFLAQLVFHCVSRFRRYELITVASFPPTVTAMVVRWLSWLNGCRYLYHCQDLYPEIAEASGIIKRKWLANLAMSIDRRNCQRASALVTLSSDMTDTLKSRGIEGSNMHVINNFVIDKFNPDIRIDDSLRKTAGTFRILFAGNLGRFQNLGEVMKAAVNLKHQPKIQFYFVGAGAMETELKSLAMSSGILDKTVFFRPFQPLDVVMRVIHESDLSIVSLTPGVINCAYPSKTMSYVEAGCRILGLLEPDSELAKLIREKNLGSVSDGLSADHIADAIENEFKIWKSNQVQSEEIRKVGNELFGKEVILNKWSRLLRQLETANGVH